MCGITGIFAFNELGRFFSINLSKVVESLKKRGPDYSNMSLHNRVNLGHTRLSIIDLSFEANQPMKDESGRYTIIYNGEIFNYKALRERLLEKGISFRTQSDTEVLLKGYMLEKEAFLHRLQGFFALAIYDETEEELFIARDRLGVKPLVMYWDEDKFIFASEMKAMMNFGILKELDYVSLGHYLHFNYIPEPYSIFRNVKKLKAGHFLKVRKNEVLEKEYYQIPKPYITSTSQKLSYEAQKKKLMELLDAAVQKRLIADVPLGGFLSGGIDSSVITALASRHSHQFHTYSIGYKDEPFFDETKYAKLVAQKFNTQHTVFSLTNDDLFEQLYEVLDYTDEPFADSSALAVYILSKKTRTKVKVALSGDGADELLGGYNKHAAEYRMRKGGLLVDLMALLKPLWSKLPKSRNGFLTNKFRQMERFTLGMELTEKERYWQWAGFTKGNEMLALLNENTRKEVEEQVLESRKEEILRNISNYVEDMEYLNQVLYTDLHLVLQSDMLRKVDLMSMANSLEVRNPFLDHEVVDFVAALPIGSKINGSIRKRILQDAFRHILPSALYNRPKKGFEVPLLKWFRTDLRSLIEQDLLQEEWIEAQQIFNTDEIRKLKQQLFSNNPEDIHARIWGLIVFQYWWKKWIQ